MNHEAQIWQIIVKVSEWFLGLLVAIVAFAIRGIYSEYKSTKKEIIAIREEHSEMKRMYEVMEKNYRHIEKSIEQINVNIPKVQDQLFNAIQETKDLLEQVKNEFNVR